MAQVYDGDDKILNRIKILLDKAASTDSLEEKEACMLMVQKLMRNHQLDMSRVTSFEQIQAEGVEEDEVLYDEIHEEDLLHYLAICTSCKVILLGRKVIPDYDDEEFKDIKCETMIKPGDFKLRVALIGEPSNVRMVLYMYSFYRNAILELAIKKYTEFLTENMVSELKLKLPKGHKEKFIENYVCGCVKGVFEKMMEAKRQEAAQNADMKGLILSKEDKVKKYVQEHYPNISGGAAFGGNQNAGAYNSGRQDGYGLSHNAGVDQGNRGYVG